MGFNSGLKGLNAISKAGSLSVFRSIGERAEHYLVSPSNNQQALDINLNLDRVYVLER